MSTSSLPVHILVADDVQDVRDFLRRLLEDEGYKVTLVEDGAQARERLAAEGIDIVVSDIGMPNMNGLQLLEFINKNQGDVPVVFITGNDDFASAKAAVNGMAVGYVTKPLKASVLLPVLKKAERIRQGMLDRKAADAFMQEHKEYQTVRKTTERVFENALSTLHMAFQPIVSARDGSMYGYEALVRNNDEQLRSPPDLLAAAAELGREKELSRRIRACVAQMIPEVPESIQFFVNLLPADILDEELYLKESPLTKFAQRVVLEITERGAVHEVVQNLPTYLTRLRQMGFRLAVDDYGAGNSNLSQVLAMEPEVIKLDMGLIRGLPESPVKRRAVARNCEMFREEMNCLIVAEGIETTEERDILRTMKVDLLQGYLFGKPAKTPTPHEPKQ